MSRACVGDLPADTTSPVPCCDMHVKHAIGISRVEHFCVRACQFMAAQDFDGKLAIIVNLFLQNNHML